MVRFPEQCTEAARRAFNQFRRNTCRISDTRPGRPNGDGRCDNSGCREIVEGEPRAPIAPRAHDDHAGAGRGHAGRRCHVRWRAGHHRTAAGERAEGGRPVGRE